MRYYFEGEAFETVIGRDEIVSEDGDYVDIPLSEDVFVWSIYDRQEQAGGKIGHVHTADLAQRIVDMLNADANA